MDFIKIEYTGSKPYRDKTPVANLWQPGDVKLVHPQNVRALLQFAEFRRYVAPEPAAVVQGETVNPAGDQSQAAANPDSDQPSDQPSEQEQQAILQQQQAEAQRQDEVRVLESMLLTVASMDKEALEAYAAKYEVKLHKNLGVEKARAQVSNLIEQFGVR